jgi:hypothetical protein
MPGQSRDGRKQWLMGLFLDLYLGLFLDLFLGLFLAGAVASGCGGDGKPAVQLPQGLNQGWNEIAPGGATTCALGAPYAFWVRPGTVNRLVIDFSGGGACWDAFTCGLAAGNDAICTQTVDGMRTRIQTGVPAGIYDHARADNPFKDWYHVIVPYCTCDIHWGDNAASYDSGQGAITVQHRGAVNARAVLDWVYANFSAPVQILVAGCSAGSYGSLGWSAHVADHYQQSAIVQFGDSGAGVITTDFFHQSFPSWKAEGALPHWIESIDPDRVNVLDLTLADLYVGISNYYPTHRFSQYNTSFDENQTFYFAAMGGGTAADWSLRMHASIDDIKARAPRFASFIAPGEQHCILPFNNFYTVNVEGRKLVDWLGDMVAGKPVEHVACQGDACQATTP